MHISSILSYPTSSSRGILEGLHPDHEDLEEYQYEDYMFEDKTENTEDSSLFQLPLSPADQNWNLGLTICRIMCTVYLHKWSVVIIDR